jgi:CheY-like chemotaxis protein
VTKESILKEKPHNANRSVPEDRTARVLILDDNPSLVLSIKTFLEDNGYETMAATRADEGLEMIRRLHPDLILLDIMMETPYSGFHICSSVKNDPKLKHIPIIGISGITERLGISYSPEADREFFNPDAYLEKPVDFQKLLEEIQALLESH